MPFSFGTRNRRDVSRSMDSTSPAPPYDAPSGEPTTQYTNANSPSPAVSYRQRAGSRLVWSAITSLCLFITVIFLIMVEIGNTYDKPALRDVWFIKLDFSNIRPISNSTPGLGYEIQQSLGLYDFYQIGLWNYCEGNNGTGIARCTTPQTLYYFNPIEMFTSQVYTNGSTAVVPPSFSSSLDVLKVSSNWMFGLFMTGAVLSFVLIPVVLMGVKSKLVSIGLSFITLLNAICVIAATIIATVLFVVIRDLFRDYEEIVNIIPTLGASMFAMMWIASIFALVAFIIQACMICCCGTGQRGLRKRIVETKPYEQGYSSPN